MCLDTVDKKPTVTEGEGWKVFSLCGDKYETILMRFRGKPHSDATWLSASGMGFIHNTLDEKYRKGFHLFRTRAGARHFFCAHSNECVLRVSFRQVTATGKQWGHDAIVAREIYIHPKGSKSAPVER